MSGEKPEVEQGRGARRDAFNPHIARNADACQASNFVHDWWQMIKIVWVACPLALNEATCVLFRLILYRVLDLPSDRPTRIPVTVCWKLMISRSRHIQTHTYTQTDRDIQTESEWVSERQVLLAGNDPLVPQSHHGSAFAGSCDQEIST